MAETLEELRRAATAAQEATKAALLAYISGQMPEGQLESFVRAEGEARYRVEQVRHREELEKAVQQCMRTARQKYRETASLRDPRPYARERG